MKNNNGVALRASNCETIGGKMQRQDFPESPDSLFQKNNMVDFEHHSPPHPNLSMIHQQPIYDRENLYNR